MREEILEKLLTEIDNLEVQTLIHQTLIKVMDETQVNGKNAEEFSAQRRVIETTLSLNKVLIAALKEKYFKKEEK